jgi:hypothetical protein
MDENVEMHFVIVKGNRGKWRIPAEASRLSAKAMQEDGISIYLLENEFVRKDSKLYQVNIQGNNKTWVLSCPLNPEFAKLLRDEGIDVLVDEIVEEKVVDKKSKSKSKGKVPR